MSTRLFPVRRLASLAAFCSLTAATEAATYYVATNGNDTADGLSGATAFLTIQRGVDAAVAGDTVLVAPGAYASGMQTTVPASGYSRVAVTKAVTVQSTHGAAQTIIQGQPDPASSPLYFGPNSVRCVYMTAGTLDGFTLCDGYANAGAAGTNMADAVKNGGGVFAPDGSTNWVPQVNNCIITRCGAYRGGGAHWVTLNNCTVVSNYVNSTSGAGVFSCHVNNSIVMFNGAANDENYPSAENSVDRSVFTASCTYPEPGLNYYGESRDGGDNITDAPLFTAGTFLLSDASPCINAGDNTLVKGTLDAAGNARIQGGIVDMGAYERGAVYNTLTVINGSGSGSYTNGTVVNIHAMATNSWVAFTGWTGHVASVANTAATNTTLVMADSNLTVVATFNDLSLDAYLSLTLGIPLPITTQNIQIGDVDPVVPEVRLGNIPDNGAAYLTTVYTNAGTVVFSWRVSSETGYDFLKLFIDGTQTNAISGTASGVVTQFVAGAGAHTIRWEYSKDGSDSLGEDAGWVGPITWTPEPLAAELGASGKPVGFPNGQPGAPLPFPYGFEACFLDSHPPAGALDGAAVRLGGLDGGGVPYLADNSTHSAEVVINGAGELSFRWCTSNSLADVVLCTIDGVEVARTSGTKNGWLTFTTNLLTVASHVVRWSYVKDSSGFGGMDAAWIDAVTWAQDTYTLTVENGTGSGTYAVGDSVALSADAPAPGYMFNTWDGDTDTITSLTTPSTTLTMPNRDITVRALYQTQTFGVTVINGQDAGAWPNAVCESTGEPEGVYPAGAWVRIVASPAPLWQTFDHWTSSVDTVVFDNQSEDVTQFEMPTNSVTVTALYRAMTEPEKLANALTIRGQPLAITSFSSNGVVAEATGGIRYDDPVVRMGGASVGPGEDVSLSTTNFTGRGALFFWWHSDSETETDGVQLEVNGVVSSPVYAEKATNRTDSAVIWYLYGFWLANDTTNVTWRFVRDDTYAIHENMVQLDRVTWIPGGMLDALNAGACFPNVNHEYDPLFQGRDHASGAFDFEGEDGGVAWVHDVPGGGDAIRIGRFGYVTNNACAQVAVTNFGTGVLSWEWMASSEGAQDLLGFYLDGTRTNWISGKYDGYWFSSGFYISSDMIQKKNTALNIFNFRYEKDADVSVLNDCGWLRNVQWHSTHKLTVNEGTIGSVGFGEDNYFISGTPVTIQANTPEDGYYFDQWTGTNVAAVLGASATDANPTFTMPGYDLTLTATYTTNAPAIPHYTLSVINGTGNGSYTNGAVVTITATLASEWVTFAGWAGDIATVADTNASPTTIQIGTNDLVVTAMIDPVPVEPLIQLLLDVPAPVTVENLSVDNLTLSPPTVTLGLIGNNQTSLFTTVYTNAGTVIFPWTVDCEEGWDFFRFSVDGTNIFSATGQASGVATNFISGDGPHLLSWSYEKDVSDSAGADCATIGQVMWIPDAIAAELGASGQTPGLPDGLDAILLDETPPSGAVDGKALRLGGGGSVGDGESVTIRTVYSGSGTLSFHWRSSSEQSHDFLILSIDGSETARISGTKSGWLLFETNLLSIADHTVEWTYVKDTSGTAGSDCGWIDSVTWAQFSYALTVENGTGGGTYAAGDAIPLAADPAPDGMEFDEWDGDIETIANPVSPTTTVTMPSRDITVRALYRIKTLAVTVINGRDAGAWPNAIHESTGEPEGIYPADAEVRIIADPAPLWQTFDHWASTNGAVFSDSHAAITTFLMPSNSVTVTAYYRAQTANEKLAGALTIAGQPLTVTSFSPNGIVAESSGGVRYNDPVVKFGGPSVGPGEHVDLTITNFTGDGVLLLWWQGGAEVGYDGLEVLVNGSSINSVSRKCSTWSTMTNRVSGATTITLRFSRDDSYFVRDNTITVDRLVWIPDAMIHATGCSPAIPEINKEVSGFEGEDGGVTWVDDAPDGYSAIRFGQFGYVTNNQCAQLSVTNFGTGILSWRWAASSEAVVDRLDFYSDDRDSDLIKGWISGKEALWYNAAYVVKSGDADRETAGKALRTFLFKYSKDEDVSVFDDCAWLRDGLWTPTFKLTLASATNTAYTLPTAFVSNADVQEEADKYSIFPVNSSITIQAEPAPEGYYFDSWQGNITLPSSSPVTFTMPTNDVTLTATYTTNAPSPSAALPASEKAARIMSLALDPSSLSQQSALKFSSLSTPTATVSLMYEGLPQTDYALEWTPSLSATEWQPLTVSYREVLGDTTEGKRIVKLYAEIPANVPQGFFRVKLTDSP